MDADDAGNRADQNAGQLSLLLVRWAVHDGDAVGDVDQPVLSGLAEQLVDLRLDPRVLARQHPDDVAAADDADDSAAVDDREALDGGAGHQVRRLRQLGVAGDRERVVAHDVGDPGVERGCCQPHRDLVGPLVRDDHLADDVGLADHADDVAVRVEHRHRRDRVPLEQRDRVLDRRGLVHGDGRTGHDLAYQHPNHSFVSTPERAPGVRLPCPLSLRLQGPADRALGAVDGGPTALRRTVGQPQDGGWR